jgi:hypothetical protein
VRQITGGYREPVYAPPIGKEVSLYRIFRRLGNGELLHIASRNSLDDAVALISSFKSLWTEEGEYVVQDDDGNVVNLGTD